MNKTAIKNFAIWARNKLIADISYKAGLLGITEKGIKSPLPQSTQTVQFFDIGTKEPSSITGVEIQQRKKLVEEIERKAKQSDYSTAHRNVIEEVAYTWFNRLIAIRFMEVNDYLPTRIRVLSSDSSGKAEPDLVTHAMEANLDYSAYEKDRIIQLKNENKLDELFRMLFIKQCNSLNTNLPELFEKTSDYTELLLNISFTDKEGVIYHLVTDIDEDDFNVSKEGQVEIIGWLYQYYNTEPKDETFALLKKNVKITKERIPAATQLFTPDWIVRYMVENSLGRLWLEGHPNEELKSNWKYYLDEVEQEDEVRKNLKKISEESRNIKPANIKVIDPAMGSGHILVYAFDVLMQIYESYGFNQRDAAKSIVENNLYGLDIDNRAYQLAYFAVMMKARQYNRRILDGTTSCHLCVIQESNGINENHLEFFGSTFSSIDREKAILQLKVLINSFKDAKEFGSIMMLDSLDWLFLRHFLDDYKTQYQVTLDSMDIDITRIKLLSLIKSAEIITRKYSVVIVNPPYMGSRGMSSNLSEFAKKYYPNSKNDMFTIFIERARKFTCKNGFYGMITQPSLLFLNSFENLRKSIINEQIIYSLLHMGRGVFGIDFGSTAFIIRNSKQNDYIGSYMKLYQRTFQYIDLEDISNLFMQAKNNSDFTYDFSSYNLKSNNVNNEIIAIDDASEEIDSITDENNQRIFYTIRQDSFSKIPGSPIAYWASKAILNAFETATSMNTIIDPRQGLATTDNNKFIRLWFEVGIDKINFDITSIKQADQSNIKWVPYNKGGARRQWYGNYDYVVNWSNNGQEIKDNVLAKYTYLKTPDFVVKNTEFYFREAITWSLIASKGFSIRYRTQGSIHDVSGMSAFSESHTQLMYILGLMSTKVANYIFKMLNPTINLQIGDFNNFPVLLTENYDVIGLVNDSIKIAKQDWDAFETSWDFKRHPLIDGTGLKTDNTSSEDGSGLYTIEEAYKNWEQKTSELFKKLKFNEEKLNKIFIKLYGLDDELSPFVDDAEITLSKAQLDRDIQSFISYAIGCILGRYSLETEGLSFAGGDWDLRNSNTSLFPDEDNILPITDEEYFQDDIVGLFIAFVERVFGKPNLEKNLKFISNALGNKGDNARDIIRNYFMKDFFKDHCKIYQKRPIYWLFDSGKKNGFKALIYMHRYDENTIGNLRIDYLHRMQRIYENEIARMQDTIENSKDAREVTSAIKRKEKLIKQLQETKEYDEKIAHLALARTSIDLDDGVKVNYEKVQTDRDGKKLDVLAKI